jgi:3-oxoadipate enol-lactonase
MTEIFVATDPDGYVACVEAIRDMDFRESNARITAPTLVIVGKYDLATTPADGETIVGQIKDAKLVSLEAAHISNVEQPQAFTDVVLSFLL